MSASYLNPNSTLGEIDLYLFNEGRHEKLWGALGAHVIRDAAGALIGTTFSVWAPNASAVSLIHDNNFWDKKTNPMVRLGNSGIWEAFLPDVGPGLKYKFAICSSFGQWVDHADPMARQCEIPPSTASIVNESNYKWRDHDWMQSRRDYQSWRSPV
ncbi:MAG: GlgB N-terminal domain-containing protein, partial [Candidatus Nanopelagicaceae bacterium]